MQVKAVVTESRNVTVSIDPVDVLTQLRAKWKSSTGQRGEYINKDGVWETWDDTGHGSGLTEYYGRATEKEIEIAKAFTAVISAVRELKNI